MWVEALPVTVRRRQSDPDAAEPVQGESRTAGLGLNKAAKLRPAREPGPRPRCPIERPLLSLRRRRPRRTSQPGREAVEPVPERCTHRCRHDDRSSRRQRNQHDNQSLARPTRVRCDACARENLLPVRPLTTRERDQSVEAGNDQRLNVNHGETSFKERRNDVCAALNVAETVPTSIPSTSPIDR